MMRVDEPNWRQAMREVFAELSNEYPECGTEPFAEAFEAVTRELAWIRRQTQREIPLSYRYELTLRRLGWPEEQFRQVIDRAVHVHRVSVCRHCWVTAEAKDVLRQCRELGIRVGVVSNFDDRASVTTLFENARIHYDLDAVVVSADVGWRKPDPSIFRVALGMLSVEPEDTLFVGDSFEEDVCGPQRVGMHAAWLLPRDAPEERRTQPDFCVRRLSDLGAILH